MARPVTIRREDILEAARRLFIEQGFSVSTAAIAREAGVSEGSIFKRFPTKEELFREAMCMGGPDLDLEARAGRGDAREELVQVTLRLLAFFEDLVPRLLRLWAQTGESPGDMLRRKGEDAPPLRVIRRVAEYLRIEQTLGRLGGGDPEILARTLVASMYHYVFLTVVVGPEAATIAPETYARGVVEQLWSGVAPTAPGGRRKP